MSEWVTVNNFKNITVFYVKPNERFDINNKTNLKFNNPMIMYTYLKCVANTTKWSGELNLVKYTDSEYAIQSDMSININDSIIQVLVMEGDDY